MNILSIESSCDETSAAVVSMGGGRRILSDIVASQIEIHALYGGVVPEVAARSHLKSIDDVVDRALENAGVDFDEIDAIAVTCGPGLVGALLSGVSCAKALAFSRGIPPLYVCFGALRRQSGRFLPLREKRGAGRSGSSPARP